MKRLILGSLLLCLAIAPFAAAEQPNVEAPAVNPTSTTEGASTSFSVSGTFTDADGTDAAEYSAVIHWGDGSPDATATVDGTPGAFTYSFAGDHTYADNGVYSVTVDVTNSDPVPATGTSTGTDVGVTNVAPTVDPPNVAPSNVNAGLAENFSVSGTFSDPAGSADEPYTVVLDWGDGSTESDNFSGDSYSFNSSHTYTAPGTYSVSVTVTDKDGDVGTSSPTFVTADPPTISIESTSTAAEDAGTLSFTVTQSAITSVETTFQYSTTNGTATGGADYESATNATGTIDAGSNTGTIVIPITNDTTHEANEDFTVTLTGATNATVASGEDTGTATITDNDDPPIVQFDQSSYSVSEGDGVAKLTITKTGDTEVNATVFYSTSNGTATEPSDYTATSTSVTLQPNQTSAEIQIPITDDDFVETPEDFTVTLDSATDATVGSPSQATVTINDDDVLPTVQFSAANYDVAEGDGMVTITVTRTGNTAAVSTVNYSTADDSAADGSDYMMKSGMVTFQPGETEQTFTVPITQDGTYEGPEKFNVALDTPVGATLGSPSTATVTITDDDNPPTSLVVTTIADTDDGFCSPTECTLREAINAANFAADTNTITFDITGPGPHTIQLTAALSNLAQNVNLNGPTNESVTVRGEGTTDPYRIFAIDSGKTVNISNLNITNGDIGLGCGGGILNSHGSLTITDSTIYGNSGGQGGGICNDGSAGPVATLTVVNSTISGNSVVGQGGGISNHGEQAGGAASLTVINSTLSGNSAATGGGGVANYGFNGGSATFTVQSTIFKTGAEGENILNASGTVISRGHNLSDDAANGDTGTGPDGDLNGTGDIRNTNPQLGTLANNGGPTLTHALLPGSPAIDAGDDCVFDNSCSPALGFSLTTDQRGQPRKVDGDFNGTATVDIGAFELDPIQTGPFVVNTTDDNDDGSCTSFHCSLREAINAANANADVSTINFAIPGSGVRTITPASALPAISQPVTIDGYSQSGASANTLSVGSDAVLLIEINGTNSGGYALIINANDTVVKGLVINRSTQSEIWLKAGTNLSVRGNFLGTDAAGTADLGNTARSGIEINGNNGNTIGGPNPADRNVISGSNGYGIFLINGASGNTVENNYIGTDKSGTMALGNATSGVLIDNRTNNTVKGNLISGNTTNGVELRGDFTGLTTPNKVFGNLIGTKANGTAALGNGSAGVIQYSGATANIIGGTSAGQGNTIAFNGSDGVSLETGINTSVRGNSIFSNTGLGIDLSPDGVTPNDPGDGDTGVNNLQNFPVITSALVGGPNTIKGTLNSTPGHTFTIDVYSSPSCDASGNGEGTTYLGSTTSTTTDGSGNASFSFVSGTVVAGDFITATATDASGNTSEFSACFQARTFAPGTIGFAQANTDSTETNSGMHTVDIIVTRSGGSDEAASVDYDVTDGTATTGDGDYSVSPASGTLNWADGDSSNRTITITVKGDTKFEADETVNLTLSNATGGAAIGTNPATLTIKNDDPQPTVSIDDIMHNEGASGTTSYNFTVSLSNPSSQTITVDYATVNGSATAPSDYTAISTTQLTFSPGETTKPVQVLVNGDNVFEPDEAFTVHLSNASASATIGDADGNGTITNDDTIPTISINDVTQNEGNSGNTSFDFTVSLTNPSYQTITVNYATADGTATAPSDYTAAATTQLTFNPGETSKTVTVLVKGETIHEANETFFVNLSSPSNVTSGDMQGLGTITNDDPVPAISISNAAPQNEGNTHGDENLPDETNHTFTVSLSNPSDQTITVDYATANGSATAGSDYNAVSTTTLTFNPGDTSKLVTVVVKGDITYEPDETFFVNLSNVSSTATINDGQGLGTITNDDAKPTLSINDRSNNEGTLPAVLPNPTPLPYTTMTFTVTKAGSTALNATVNYATADGIAIGDTDPCPSGADYQSLTTGSLTFLPNETTKQITVSVCKDSDFEANETFFVNLTAPVNATLADDQGQGTILNDDIPSGGFTVNTTDDVDDTVCDSTHCSLREAIIAANNSNTVIAIKFDIPADDNKNGSGPSRPSRHFYYKDDGIENHVTNDAAHVLITTAADDASLPIDPDPNPVDPDWPHSWWSILPTSPLPAATKQVFIDGYSQTGAVFNSLATGTNAVLRIELDGASAGANVNGLTISGSTSTVRGLVINRFRKDSGDPTPAGNGLSLPSGGNTISGNFIGPDVSGTLDNSGLDVTPLLGIVTGNGISASFNNIIGGSTPDVINLVSGNGGDGIAVLNVTNTIRGNLIGTKADGTTALGNGGSGLSFSGGGSGFNTIGGIDQGDGNTIAFNSADGLTLSTANVGNSIRGNSIYSNGTTNLHLGIDLGTDGVTPNDPAIDKDADTGPNNLQNFPVITTARVTGSTQTIIATLNAEAGQTFDIDFYANATCDITGGNGEGQTYLGSITTAETNSSGDVSFTFHPDASHAAAMAAGKFITATATSTGALFNTSEFSACLEVEDGSSGAGDIQFASSAYSVPEQGGPAKIIIRRVGGSNGTVTAKLSTSNGTAGAGDYTSITDQTITFVEGETADKTIDITINNDLVYEGDETVNLALTTTQITAQDGQSRLAADPHAAVLTIVDNDPKPTFSINDVTKNEGNTGQTIYTFTVTKAGSTALTASVDYSTNNGTASGGSDFTPVAATTLTFQAGDTTKQVAVSVKGDTTVEPNETFTVHLANASNATISDADGTGTILNDDVTPSPTPTATATATATATPTATASATVAPSATATPTASATPTATPVQALNISTRLRVGTGDKAMIAGYIITGNSSTPVVLRGMGPSLEPFGITDFLADPVLELHGENGSVIVKNDNWKDDQRGQIEGTIFEPGDDNESVILATLSPAAYTAILTGKDNGTGVGLVEVYDTDQALDSALANISTRGFVEGGNNVMIGGFILGGSSKPSRIALRGIGHSLSQFGLSPVLEDPTLEVHDANGATLVSNDNWTDDPVSAAQLTANGLALKDPNESGIFTSLPAGQFTAILAGKDGGVGIGLVEIYNLK